MFCSICCSVERLFNWYLFRGHQKSWVKRQNPPVTGFPRPFNLLGIWDQYCRKTFLRALWIQPVPAF